MALIIFIIAFVIRLICIIQLKATIFYSQFLLDEAFYNNWAREIAGGKWLGDKAFDAMPLYPYFLAVVYKIFGYNLFMPRLIEAIIGSVSCILVYLITKKYFGKRAGIISGFVACCYGPFIFYNALLVPTTLVIFFYLCCSWVLVNLNEKPTRLKFFLFGFVVGLAALARPAILLFLPVVLIWMAFMHPAKKKVAVGIVLAIIGTLLIIAPVTVRNYMVSGDVVFLTSHGGMNFFIGNNKDADGTFKAPAWARSNIKGLKADTKTMAEAALGRPLKGSEVSNYYYNKGKKFISEHTFQFLKIFGRKLLLFVNKEELYDVAHYRIYQDQIPILQLPFLSFIIIGPLGLAGILLSFPMRKRIGPLYIFILTYFAAIIAFFVNSRYRLPLAVMLIIFVGFTLDWFIRRVEEKRYRAIAGALGICAAFIILVSLPIGATTVGVGYGNLGNLYMKVGEPDNAIIAFEKAIESDPENPKLYNDIGYIYLMQNKPKAAKRYLSASLSKDPQYPFARINLGLLYQGSGDIGKAEKEYKRAIRINPNIAEAHNNLANIYVYKRRYSLAVEEYQKAIELEPNNAKTHYNLAIVYGRQGQDDRAKEEFSEAARIDPDFAPAKKALEYFKVSP